VPAAFCPVCAYSASDGFFDNIPQDLLIRAAKKHAKEQ